MNFYLKEIKNMAKKSGKKKTVEKTTATVKKGEAVPTKRTRKSSKGGFGVFTVASHSFPTPEENGLFDGEMILTQVAENLKDTAAGTAWIKENAETYEGQELAIVQIKKIVKVKLTQTTKVTLE